MNEPGDNSMLPSTFSTCMSLHLLWHLLCVYSATGRIKNKARGLNKAIDLNHLCNQRFVQRMTCVSSSGGMSSRQNWDAHLGTLPPLRGLDGSTVAARAGEILPGLFPVAACTVCGVGCHSRGCQTGSSLGGRALTAGSWQRRAATVNYVA
jgi:hypothetical protein